MFIRYAPFRASPSREIGQFGFQQKPYPGVQIVGLPELSHTVSIPGLPGLLDRTGDLLGIALQNPYRVAVPGQQHRRR